MNVKISNTQGVLTKPDTKNNNVTFGDVDGSKKEAV